MRAALRRQAAIALLVWALAFSLLAAANALPSGPTAILAVDDASPTVGEAVRFDASGSSGHDAGNGAIVAYRFSFGDGAGTGWQAAPYAHHAYAVQANVTARVAVVDGRGLQDDASLGIVVRSRPHVVPTADLLPVQAMFSPAGPRVGDAVSVAAILLNDGNATATAATVRFLDVQPGGSVRWIGNASLPAPVPPSGTASVVSPPFDVAVEGNHTIRVIVTGVEPATTLGDRELRVTIAVLAAGGPTPGMPTRFVVTPLVAGLAGAGVISLAVALLILFRPRPPGPLEPPPPAPRDRSPPPIWPP